jgi:pimeloyl-ACP methyl ester carboxylesterase
VQNSIAGTVSAILMTLLVARAAGIQPQPTGRLVDAGSYRVHLFCTGSGSPTVMIAGGGFSFDWGLIQPAIAQTTRICTYDAAGTAWSDRFPTKTPGRAQTCAERVGEIHSLLVNAPEPGPYVLVGYSIGGLYARLYAATYPKDVGAMVLVDHAFLEPGHAVATATAPDSQTTLPTVISQTPVTIGIEDDRNFRNLPRVNQQLHAWAMSANPVRPTPQMAAECFDAVSAATAHQSRPLGNTPLIVVSTLNDSPKYDELQRTLLAQSAKSIHMVAANSTHMVIVDEPEVVIEAIRQAQQMITKQNRAAPVESR